MALPAAPWTIVDVDMTAAAVDADATDVAVISQKFDQGSATGTVISEVDGPALQMQGAGRAADPAVVGMRAKGRIDTQMTKFCSGFVENTLEVGRQARRTLAARRDVSLRRLDE